MSIKNYNKNKSAFIFELDDVIYPEKDYLLQVYYLFANFIESEIGLSANEIIKFMKNAYEISGSDNLFSKTAKEFSIPTTYEKNFDLLHENIRLPLKLFLYQKILSLCLELIANDKKIFLFIKGKPTQQLNKLKQIEWHNLEQHLTVYFTEESSPENCLHTIINQHKLEKKDIIFIGNSIIDEKFAQLTKLDFLFVKQLI